MTEIHLQGPKIRMTDYRNSRPNDAHARTHNLIRSKSLAHFLHFWLPHNLYALHAAGPQLAIEPTYIIVVDLLCFLGSVPLE